MKVAKLAATALLGLGCMALSGRAEAVPLDVGTYTVGSLTIDVSLCTNCAAYGAELVAGSHGFTITGPGGGTLMTSSSGILDMSVGFEVTSTAPLHGVTLSVAGSSSGTGVAKVDENWVDAGLAFTGNGTGFAGGSATWIPFTGGPFTDVFIDKDISANPGAAGTVTIESVTQTFAVPEPAGMSLLAMGLLGLLAVRRRHA